MMADSNCSVALYAGFELAIQIQTSTVFLEKILTSNNVRFKVRTKIIKCLGWVDNMYCHETFGNNKEKDIC
jgi:hypothetical protein